MLMNKIKLTTTVLLFIASLSSFSQEDTKVGAIVTDRPDATEASSTVGKGNLQFETGGLYESFEESSIKSENYVYNTMLIRYGILDNVELRLGWNFIEGVTKVSGNKLDNVASGLTPLLLGLKIDIAEEKSRLTKAMDKLGKEIGGLKGRLNNPNFAVSAPEEVVEEARVNLEAREDEASKLQAALNRLAEIG